MVTSPDIPDWLRRQYPFSPKRHRTVSGAGLSYLDEGPRSDEAVLMLHGNPTWSYFYRHLVAAVSPRCRCIVPDHVGMGLSDKPADYSYTLATRIDDVLGLLGTLGLRRIHLVVHDWGGAIGFGVAARILPQVGRLVVLNTAAFRSDRIPLRIALCRQRGLGTWLVRQLNGFAAPATRMAMHRRTLTDEERRGYLFPYDSWQSRVAVDAFVKDIPLRASDVSYAALHQVEKALPGFRRHPVSLIWGGRDFCFNDHFLERWKQFLPEAQVTRLADVGHYVLDDGGAEAISLCQEALFPEHG
ncbi:MAG: alpha/beta fold hydrolase [Opitutaceae bacterium]|nr:alpha/beta fold hydrolase [Opitutaceae bacterium]